MRAGGAGRKAEAASGALRQCVAWLCSAAVAVAGCAVHGGGSVKANAEWRLEQPPRGASTSRRGAACHWAAHAAHQRWPEWGLPPCGSGCRCKDGVQWGHVEPSSAWLPCVSACLHRCQAACTH